MPVRVIAVDADADFDGLIACQWAAFESPYQGILRIVCPITGTGPSARADSLKASTQRQLAWHKSDPTAYWEKAVNDQGSIVGAAQWKIFDGNPFAKSSGRPSITWYPEGPQRDFASAVLQRVDATRKEKAQRAQVYLNNMFIHPEYRGQGLGDLLMTWGVQKADELGYEMWVNASKFSISLYKRHGFVVLDKLDLCPPAKSSSPEWTNMRDQLQIGSVWPMWRPVGGSYVEGETVKPWEQAESAT